MNKFLTSDSPVYQIDCRTYTNKTAMSQTHYHYDYELLYVCENSRSIKIGDNYYVLDKNSVALIPPFIPHATYPGNFLPQRRICINFRPEFISDIQKTIPMDLLAAFKADKPVISIKSFSDEFYNCISTMENKTNEPSTTPKIRTLSLVRLCELLLMLNGVVSHGNSDGDIFYDIIKFAEENFNQRISLDLLAKKFYLDPYTISRNFNKITGLTLPKYMKTIRVIHAKQKLSSTDMSLTDIATYCGFNSLVDFDRVFKQDTGMTPLQYRKSTKNN